MATNLLMKIVNTLNSQSLENEKLKEIKSIVLDEMRMQALKATPARAKASTVLTKMYKANGKIDERWKGYVKLEKGFALTNSYYALRFFDGSADDLLPIDAMEIQGFTAESVNHLFKVDVDSEQTITISYGDVMAHIKQNGRSKKSQEMFSVPNSDILLNVFYLEYAFKLAQKQELTFYSLNSGRLLYLKESSWDMLICAIIRQSEGTKN